MAGRKAAWPAPASSPGSPRPTETLARRQVSWLTAPMRPPPSRDDPVAFGRLLAVYSCGGSFGLGATALHRIPSWSLTRTDAPQYIGFANPALSTYCV
jgi:hypothetical protein